MTGKDILKAIGDIDEKYVDEAGKKATAKKGIIIRFSAMAACLTVIAAGAFAAFKATQGKAKSNSTADKSTVSYVEEAYDKADEGNTTDISDKKGGGTNGANKSFSSSETYEYRIKKWDEKNNAEKFPLVKINGTEYSVANKTVPADKTGEKIKAVTVLGKDEYTASEYAANAEIYEIKGISGECAAAVKYGGDEKYYICRNSAYKPETLGQFISDLDLKNTLTFNTVYGTQKEKGKSADVEYSGWDKEKVWELLFSDTQAKAVKDIDTVNFEMAVDITINLEILGYENYSLSVSREGYILINILSTGRAFYIGKPAAEKFISYLNGECKVKVIQTYDYSEPNYTSDSDDSGSTSSFTPKGVTK